MSYLLKALEKAEKERQAEASEEAANIKRQTVTSIPAWLIWLVVAILMITLAHMFGLIGFASDDKEIESINVSEVVIKKTAEPELMDAGKESDSQSLHQSLETFELVELNPSQLSLLPSIELQSHIFSPRSEMRSVIINNQSYEEGDLISSGVVLKEITNKGVVLQLHGFKVYLDKGITWVAK